MYCIGMSMSVSIELDLDLEFQSSVRVSEIAASAPPRLIHCYHISTTTC